MEEDDSPLLRPYGDPRDDYELGRKIIRAALADAVDQTKTKKARWQAMRWLTGASEEFAHVCAMARTHPNEMRRIARRTLRKLKVARPHALITYKGETKNVTQWAAATGLSAETVSWRARQGWDAARILDKPVRNRNLALLLTHDGVTDSLRGWARRTGIPRPTIRLRLTLGWTVEHALTVSPAHDRLANRLSKAPTASATLPNAPEKCATPGVGENLLQRAATGVAAPRNICPELEKSGLAA